MHITRTLACAVVAGLFVPSVAVACLWDYDTLLEERGRFPTALELITGKFLRHTPEFYEWRIRDRLAGLKSDPENLAYRDDLAVAYHKTGQTDEAIEVMLESLQKYPNRYETQANLGTFYIFAGQLDKSLEHIDKALRINPNAHFGREKYQRWLVEYILECRKNSSTNALPLQQLGPDEYGDSGFFTFVANKHKGANSRNEAVKAILGMMRFANHENPILLEVLANSLGSACGKDADEDAKRLAARALLKASYLATDRGEQAAYRELSRKVLHSQVRSSLTQGSLALEELETDFKQELAEADSWYSNIREDELGWIKSGIDPEQAFVKKYYNEPTISVRLMDTAFPWLIASVVAVVVVSLLIRRRVGRLHESSQPSLS